MKTKKLFLITLITILSLNYVVYAQTSTPTPTPTPNTTELPPATSTTFADPSPTLPNVGVDTIYYTPPTIIPTPNFPNLNLPTPPPIPQFATPEINIPATPNSSLPPINTSFNLNIDSPSPLTKTNNNFNAIIEFNTNISNSFRTAISYVTSISNDINTFMNGNGDLITATTGYTVPDWYVPTMPDELRQIGWDFETMGTDLRRRYGVLDWLNFFTTFIIVLVQFIKGIFALSINSGPLGLFLIWLFIMAPLVLAMRGIIYGQIILITLFNLIIRIVRFIISWIPGVG